MDDITTMYELCIEKINEAKICTAQKDKIVSLEQVKEVILYRVPDLIPIVLPEIATFLSETSKNMKKYVAEFICEACKTSIEKYNNPKLALLEYLKFVESVVSHNIDDDKLIKKVIDDLSDKYDSIVLQIANNMTIVDGGNINSSSSGGGSGSSFNSKDQRNSDPKELWKKFCEVTRKIEASMAHAKSSEVRGSILHLMEVSILFGLPPPSQKLSNDPRRRNASAAATSSSKTCDLIPSHHLIIDKSSLTSDAETLFNKLFIWSSNNGPKMRPFDPSLMCKLGVVLTLIAEGRPSHKIKEINDSPIASAASEAISSIVQSKSSLCPKMLPHERTELARAISKLQIVLRVNNTDVTAVTVALQELHKMSASSLIESNQSIPSVLGKREHDEEEEIDLSTIRDSAHASLIASEERMRELKIQRLAGAATTGNSAVDSIMASKETASIIHPFTELSFDLLDFRSISEASQPVIVTTKMSDYSIYHSVDSTWGGDKKGDNFQDAMSDMSFSSLVRLLTSFDKLQKYGKQALFMQVQLASRLAIKLAQDAKLSTDCPLSITVPIVQHLQSVPTENFDLMSIPQSIFLPKSIWCLISYVFFVDDKVYKNLALGNQHIIEKMPLLFCLMNTLHSIGNKVLYNEVCLVIVAKFLSNATDKNFAIVRKELGWFIFKIPCIVPACLDLFRAMLYTGSNSEKKECLSLLSQIATRYTNEEIRSETFREVIFNEKQGLDMIQSDELRLGYMALKYLLWSTLSLTHAISTNAIFSLKNEVIPKSAVSKIAVEKFATYCVSYLVPPNAAAFLIDRENLRPVRASSMGSQHVSLGRTVISTPKKEDASSPRGGSAMEVDGVAAGGGGSSSEQSSVVNHSSISAMLPHEVEVIYKVFSKKVSEISDASELKLFLQRAIKLLTEVSSSCPTVLLALFDLFAACSAIGDQKVEVINEVIVNYSSILTFVKEELDKLLESQFRSRSDLIIDLFFGADPLSLPLVESCLYSLNKNYMDVLPSESLVSNVKRLASACFSTQSTDMESDSKESSEYILTANTVRIFIPILGSLSADCIQANLPLIIKTVGDNQEGLLEKAFWRIIDSRPPPLKRDKLLLFLFRLDFKAHGIDRKLYLSSIESFLNSKNSSNIYLLSNVQCQFDSDVFENVMKQLLKDPVIPVGLMYICMKLANREAKVKDFIYKDAIPGLLLREVYIPSNNMKNLFDGIKQVFITMDAREITPTILGATTKSLFGLPIDHLKAMVATTIDAKKNVFRPYLSKYLKAIGANSKEKDELASGDLEKGKIIQELISS